MSAPLPLVAGSQPQPNKPNAQSRWSTARARLRSLDAAEWPDPAPKPSPYSAAEHAALFNDVRRPLQALRTLVDGEWREDPLAAHLLLYAYRFVRQTALASRSVSRGQPLAAAPPRLWSADLQLPSSLWASSTPLTLDAHQSPDTFPDYHASAHHLLPTPFGSPAHMAAQLFALDPMTLILCWPFPEEILAQEAQMLDLCEGMLHAKGRFVLVKFLEARFGMGQGEALEFSQVAMHRYKSLGQVDPDTERGLLLSRIERYYRRAIKGQDLQAEGNALKLHAAVVGLTRDTHKAEEAEPADLVAAIKKVHAENPPKPKRLPAPQKDGTT